MPISKNFYQMFKIACDFSENPTAAPKNTGVKGFDLNIRTLVQFFFTSLPCPTIGHPIHEQNS